MYIKYYSGIKKLENISGKFYEYSITFVNLNLNFI